MKFEPICLEAFNDARECLFRTDGQVRLCENELSIFEECQHDPVAYSEFMKLSTMGQSRKRTHTWASDALRSNYA